MEEAFGAIRTRSMAQAGRVHANEALNLTRQGVTRSQYQSDETRSWKFGNDRVN